MKSILCLIAALFFSSADAQTRVPLRIFHIFTPNAVLRLSQTNTSAGQWVASNIIALNQAYQSSGMQTRAESAGFNSTGNLCCGANVADTGHIYTDPGTKQGSVAWAANNPDVHKAREAAWADIVVVVSDNNASVEPVDDVSGYSYQRCDQASKGAQRSIVGVNMRPGGGISVEMVYAHEVGHVACAMHDDNPASGAAHGTYWVTGTSPANCQIYGTLLAVPKPITGPVTTWTVTENGLTSDPGQGPTPDQANLVMSGFCAVIPNYTCVPVGSCSLTSATNATCTHYRTYIPTSTTQLVTSFGSSQTNTFTCPENRWQRLNRYSNPNLSYGGVATGNANANNAAVIDAESLNVQTYRDAKVSRMLIEAARQ